MREKYHISYTDNGLPSTSPTAKQAELGLHFYPFYDPNTFAQQRLEGIDVLRTFDAAYLDVRKEIKTTRLQSIPGKPTSYLLQNSADWLAMINKIGQDKKADTEPTYYLYIGNDKETPIMFKAGPDLVGYQRFSSTSSGKTFVNQATGQPIGDSFIAKGYDELAKEFDKLGAINPSTQVSDPHLRYDHLVAQALLARVQGNHDLFNRPPFDFYKNHTKLLDEAAVLLFVSEAVRDNSHKLHDKMSFNTYSSLGTALIALDLIAMQATYGQHEKPFLFKNMLDSIRLARYNNRKDWFIMETTKVAAGKRYSPVVDAKVLGQPSDTADKNTLIDLQGNEVQHNRQTNRHYAGKLAFTGKKVEIPTIISDGKSLTEGSIAQMYAERRRILNDSLSINDIITHRVVVKDIALVVHWLENVKPLGDKPTAATVNDIKPTLRDLFKQRLTRAYLLDQTLEATLSHANANPNSTAQITALLNSTHMPYLGALSDLERSTLGGKALLTAVQDDNFELAEHLLKQGANPNVQDKIGNTPLHLAVNYVPDKRDFSYANLLLKYNADVMVEDRRYKQTPRGLIKQALDKKNEDDDEDESADSIEELIRELEAHERLQGSIVKSDTSILFDHLAGTPEDIKQAYTDKLFLLDVEKNSGKLLLGRIEELFLLNAVDPDFKPEEELSKLRNIKDADNNTLLHRAVKTNNFNVIEELAPNKEVSNVSKPYIDTQNGEGKTALHLACQQGNSKLIKLLLGKGAKTVILDETGKLPLDYFRGDKATAYLLAQKQKEELLKMAPEIQKLADANQNLINDLTAANQAKQAIEAQLKDKTGELAEMAAFKAKAEESLTQAQARVQTLEQEKAGLQSQLENAEKREKTLQQQVNTLADTNQNLINDLNAANQSKQAIEAKLKDKTSELAEMTKQKSKTEESLVEAQDTAQTLEKEKTELRSHLDERTAELDEKSTALATAQEQVNNLTSEVTHAKGQNMQLATQRDEAIEKTASTEKHLASLAEKLTASQTQNSQLTDALSEETAKTAQAEEEVIRLQSNLDDKDKTIADMQAIIDQLRQAQTSAANQATASSTATLSPTSSTSSTSVSPPSGFVAKLSRFFQSHGANPTSENDLRQKPFYIPPSSEPESNKRKAPPSPPNSVPKDRQVPEAPNPPFKKQAPAGDSSSRIISLASLEQSHDSSAQNKTPDSSPANSPRGSRSV